jgi:hypothetical protein
MYCGNVKRRFKAADILATALNPQSKLNDMNSKIVSKIQVDAI